MSTKSFTAVEVSARSRQFEDYRRNWYAQQLEPTYRFIEYTPQGRFLKVETNNHGIDSLAQDWYNRNGIPHEVSTPNPDEWLPFKKWMMEVARGWWRPLKVLDLNPEMFGPVGSTVQINYFQVMKTRIAQQREFSFWTRVSHERQVDALTNSETRSTYTPLQTRQELILFSLMGLNSNRDASDNNSAEADSLRRFVRFPHVQRPFKEFVSDYLDSNPNTKNPCWNIMQPHLANPDLDANITATYGEGKISERLTLAKGHWSREDHCIRFIISLYRLTRQQLLNDGIGPDQVGSGFLRYFLSETRAVGMDDRYWFGFSLLNLLIKSWQYNQTHPRSNYEETLIPALYEGYEPRNLTFPEAEVGQIDLSPLTPWAVTYNRQDMDFDQANTRELIDAFEQDDLYEPESDTELELDGSQPRVPVGQRLWRNRRRGSDGRLRSDSSSDEDKDYDSEQFQ